MFVSVSLDVKAYLMRVFGDFPPQGDFFPNVSVFLSSSNRKTSTASKHVGGFRLMTQRNGGKWRMCQNNREITGRCSVRETLAP